MTVRPRLRVFGPRAAGAVVLVLHGGQEESKQRAHPLRPAYLRMLPFTLDLYRCGRRRGIAVWQLCNRYRGWNKPDLDAVADARWALSKIHRACPDAPVALVGHSMGARVALRVADDPAVVGVCALAPWTTSNDHVGQLAGKAVLIAHGELDTTTDPRESHAYAERARQVNAVVSSLEVRGDGHAMLRRPREWTLLVRGFVLGVLAAQQPH